MTDLATTESAEAEPRKASLPAWLRVLRPHQWSKNILLFTPPLLAHVLPWHGPRALQQWTQSALGFGAFCFMASIVYVVNDVVDVHADRDHPTKRRRPFASGELSPKAGLPIILALVVLAGICCLSLPPRFLTILAIYCITSLAYSFWLKQRLLVDVFTLAGLYTLRIIAGGAAAGVAVSNWMLAFSIFLFTSLAFAKRFVELDRLRMTTAEAPARRAYQVGDLDLIRSIGPASGYLAVLVLALYVNDGSAASASLYRQPLLLWLLCPLLMYWITRIWFIACRGALDDDPIAFALTDRVSWFVLGIAGLLVVLASQPWPG